MLSGPDAFPAYPLQPGSLGPVGHTLVQGQTRLGRGLDRLGEANLVLGGEQRASADPGQILGQGITAETAGLVHQGGAVAIHAVSLILHNLSNMGSQPDIPGRFGFSFVVGGAPALLDLASCLLLGQPSFSRLSAWLCLLPWLGLDEPLLEPIRQSLAGDLAVSPL